MARHRWEWVEGLKPETAVQVGVKHVVKLIADGFDDWPPEILWEDPSGADRFADVVAPGAPRPSLAAFREAIRRVTWELGREHEAIDFYERNHHLERACPARYEQLASELMREYILESFFSLIELTENRVTRRDALEGVALLSRSVEARWSVR